MDIRLSGSRSAISHPITRVPGGESSFAARDGAAGAPALLFREARGTVAPFSLTRFR